MLTGLWHIISQPSKISANYFAMGGYAATFLNMGLVGLLCLGLFVVFKGTPNNVSTLSVLLTIGFCSWGINVLNMWFSILGVVIYSLVNAMLFSTGIAPLITELLVRYPSAEYLGFNVPGLLLALVVGFVIGFFLPAGLAYYAGLLRGLCGLRLAVSPGGRQLHPARQRPGYLRWSVLCQRPEPHCR